MTDRIHIQTLSKLHTTGVETRHGASLQHVTLETYDLPGSEVATLVNEPKEPGVYKVEFNASSAGGGLPSGVYFYKLTAGNYSSIKKLVLLK